MDDCRNTDNSHPDRRVPKLLMSYEEASWSLGLCERTLRNMVADGRLPAVRLGGRTLFDVADLQAIVQTHRMVRSKADSEPGPNSVQ